MLKGVLKNNVLAYGATLRGAGVYVQYGAVECDTVAYGAEVYGARAFFVGVYAAVTFGAVECDVVPYGAVVYDAGAFCVGANAVVVFGAEMYCGVARSAVLYAAALGGAVLFDSTLPLSVLVAAISIGATPAPAAALTESAGRVEAVVVGSLKEIVPAG